MRTRTLEKLRRHLHSGRVYRREDLLPWSHSVDRHLKDLVADGTLQKLRTRAFDAMPAFMVPALICAPLSCQRLLKHTLRAPHIPTRPVLQSSQI